MTPYWHVTLPMTLAYIVIALVIGVFAARGKLMARIETWAVAARGFGVFVLFFLFGAGAISAYTFLGAPGWGYSTGVNIFYVTAYLTLGYFTVFFFAGRLWRVGNKFKFVTQASVFRHRFDSPVLGVIAAIIGCLACVGYGITQGMGVGYILNFASGGIIPFWGGVAIVYGVMATYIAVSGLRAIGWTNTFQGIMMAIVAWIAGPMVVHHFYAGGFGTLFSRLATEAPKFLTLAGSGWSNQFWVTCVVVCALGIICWPTFWIMFWGAKSAKILRRSVALVPLYWFVMLPMIIIGFAGILVKPGVTPADTIAMKMSLDALPLGLTGLLFAATLAAAMSSCEILILNAGLQTIVDIVNPFTHMKPETITKWSRLCVIPFAALIGVISVTKPATLVGMLLMTYGWLVQLFPLIVGTLFWKGATKYGAIAGTATGLVVSILFTKVWPHPLGIHAGMWGLVINAILFVGISLLTKDKLPSKEIIDGYFREKVEA